MAFYLNRKNVMKMQHLKNGTVIVYSLAFSWDEVKAIAKRNGITIRYCTPETIQYKMYGAHTCIAYRIRGGNPDYKPRKIKEKLDMGKKL